MAQVRNILLRFRQAAAADVVANRVRIRPANTPAAYDEPFHQLDGLVPDGQGYVQVPLASIPQAAGLEGTYDVHITAVDAVGHESDFLELDQQTFDLSPPDAPTDGSIVYGA
jgi:hypothetical protein